MKTFVLFGTLLLAIVAIADSGLAANTGIVKIDRISCLYGDFGILTTGNPRFDIRFINNTGEKVSVNNGLRIFSPDGANWYTVAIDTIFDEATHKSPFASYFNVVNLFAPGHEFIDTVGVAGFALPGDGLPDGYNALSVAITVTCPPNAQINDGKHLCIDTVSSQAIQWKWFGAQAEYIPEFQAIGATYGSNGFCWAFFHSSCGGVPTAATTAPAACPTCACCISRTGNVNMTGIVDLADLSTLIAYLTVTPQSVLPCQAEANVNKTGIIDLADLSMLIAYLTAPIKPELPLCP